MGKKMGENSKAVAARERKNEKATAEKAAKEKAIEDAKWMDNDKSLAKKQVKVCKKFYVLQCACASTYFLSQGKKTQRRKDWMLLPKRRKEKKC